VSAFFPKIFRFKDVGLVAARCRRLLSAGSVCLFKECH
jgi:hypothetical protein